MSDLSLKFLMMIVVNVSFVKLLFGSQNDLVYTTSFRTDEYVAVKTLLRTNFDHFPINKTRKKIVFLDKELSYSLKIILKKRKVKILYKDNCASVNGDNKVLLIHTGEQSNIEEIESKVKTVKSRIEGCMRD